MDESPLISFEEGGRLLGGLHHTTLRQRKAGTELLTHVPMGRRKMLVRAEVLALAQSIIKKSVDADRERKSLIRMAS